VFIFLSETCFLEDEMMDLEGEMFSKCHVVCPSPFPNREMPGEAWKVHLVCITEGRNKGSSVVSCNRAYCKCHEIYVSSAPHPKKHQEKS
jgi:hypothetical protein